MPSMKQPHTTPRTNPRTFRVDQIPVFLQEMKQLLALVLLCVVLAGCTVALTGCTDEFTQKQRESAKEVEGLMDRDGALMVYSLDPELRRGTSPGDFHGYRIIGQQEVTDPKDRRELLNQLAESIRENSGVVAACFIPRHGLRFKTDDTQLDLVICFECFSARGYGTTQPGILLTSSARAAFDGFLDKHGIPRRTR